jgi:hypothetical protein
MPLDDVGVSRTHADWRRVLPALMHDPRTLPQRDPRPWPACDRRPVGRLCHLEVVYHNPLFDHLVRNGEKSRWHSEAERLGRVEIDHEFEFGGLKNWQVGRLVTAKYTACIDTG